MRSRTSLAAGALLAAGWLTAGCLAPDVDNRADGEGIRTTVEVMYPVAGDLGEAFQEEVRRWAETNDVEVDFSPTGRIDELIAVRVQGNDPPDVAFFSQPAMLWQVAERGELLDLTGVVAQADREAMHQDLLAIGRVGDAQYAVPVGVHVKSAVFYPSAAAQVGLSEPPATLEELRLLADRLAETGVTPWCFGAAAEDEAGWPAADWVENLMLINVGAAVYDQWVNHEIPFNDPRVADVLNQVEALLLADGRTNGGRETVADTDVRAAFGPLFAHPPGCVLYRQGQFVARDGGFPDEILEDIDNQVGVFPMPGRTPESKPVLGGGHFAAVLNQDNEAARDLVRFLASPEFGTHGQGESGTWISPRKDFDETLYPSEIWRSLARIAHGSTAFVLDGSDQMPPEVGPRAFPRELRAWISGEQDAQTTLDNIEEAWPD